MAEDDTPASPRPPTPVPAREGVLPPPTPVRESLGGEHADGPAVRTSVEIEVDGALWTACVGGMSRTGAELAVADVLLLVFEPTGGGGGGSRETLVVGSALADLTDLQVEEAFRCSRPAPEEWAPKPLFPEAGSRSGRDS